MINLIGFSETIQMLTVKDALKCVSGSGPRERLGYRHIAGRSYPLNLHFSHLMNAHVQYSNSYFWTLSEKQFLPY